MATGTNGIATRADCNTKSAGTFSSDLTKCPTKGEILATGKLGLSGGDYATNQCVKFEHVMVANAAILFRISSGVLYADIFPRMADSITFNITVTEMDAITTHSVVVTLQVGASGTVMIESGNVRDFEIMSPASPYTVAGRTYSFNIIP
jgi:hypothetical protein